MPKAFLDRQIKIIDKAAAKPDKTTATTATTDTVTIATPATKQEKTDWLNTNITTEFIGIVRKSLGDKKFQPAYVAYKKLLDQNSLEGAPGMRDFMKFLEDNAKSYTSDSSIKTMIEDFWKNSGYYDSKNGLGNRS